MSKSHLEEMSSPEKNIHLVHLNKHAMREREFALFFMLFILSLETFMLRRKVCFM